MRPLRARLGVGLATLFVAIAMLAGCDGGGSTPAAQPSRGSLPACPSTIPRHSPLVGTAPQVPRSGDYLGGFSLTAAPTPTGYLSSYHRLQRVACRSLDLAHVYLRWNYSFPNSVARSLVASHHYLLVSWTGTDLAQMASGALDAQITDRARQLASINAPIFLELRWEMDRPNLRSVVHSPATFIAAWQHTRQLFAAAGVRNVVWVWCPLSTGFQVGRAQAYYPGDDEVDWVCADAYPASPAPSRPFPSLASEIAPMLSFARQHDKPAMVGEFGIPQSYPADTRRAWLVAAAQTLAADRRIKAAGYFDYATAGTPSASDYALGAEPPVVQGFRALVDDPRLKLRL
jgi:hypothetical protein